MAKWVCRFVNYKMIFVPALVCAFASEKSNIKLIKVHIK